MTARELFEDARAASWELHRHDLKYDAMERRALSLGCSIATVPRGSSRDRRGAVDVLVDYSAMMEQREREWCATIDLAASVLYGDDWHHGIAKSLSLAHAEALECIYIQRMTLPQTARRVHWSTRKVCDLRREAFDFIDRVGLDLAIAGK